VTADKVIDASAFAAAVFVEPKASVVIGRIHGERLIAPGLLRFEMENVCLKKLTSRPSERDLILRQYSDSFLTTVIELPVDPIAVVELAEKCGLSTYDANYLWLALHLGAELITLDIRLDKAYRKFSKP
jgi:predicted nucleic acid-binding protein